MYDPFGIFLFVIPILVLFAWHLVFVLVRRQEDSKLNSTLSTPYHPSHSTPHR
jgi:hypothetical protein